MPVINTPIQPQYDDALAAEDMNAGNEPLPLSQRPAAFMQQQFVPSAEDMQGMALQEQYAKMQQQALQQQQAGIQKYQSDINALRNKETQVDLSPLAALADAWGSTPSNLAAAYKRPMSADEKNNQIMALQEKLQAQKDKQTDNRSAALLSAISAYKIGRENPLKQKLIESEIYKNTAAGRASDTAAGVRIEKDVQQLANKIGGAQDIKIALDAVEKTLGFKLDDYDEASGTVKGKPVDLPGVAVPGLGAVRQFTSEGRQLNQAISKVFNVELKDRSGAAVTSGEMQRLKDEFSNGKFNTEAEQIAALKAYRTAAAAEMAQREAAFRPEVLNKLKSRGAITSGSFVDPERARYEELKKKAQESP